MTVRIPLLLAAAALTGCTTLADIRALLPQMTEMIAAPSEPTGSCVHNKLLLQHPEWLLLTSNDRGTFHIAAEPNGTGAPQGQFFIWAVAFVPRESQTLVEVRTKMTIWGDPQHPRDLWQIIKSCG